MKNLIAIVLAIACAAALMLTGCGNNNDPQPEPQPTELTGSISTDDRYKVPLIQMKSDAVQSNLFIDGSRIKGFVNFLNIKH